MSTLNLIAAAIYSKLASGTALTTQLSGTTAIYHHQAPDAAAYPFVIFGLAGGGPANINPSDIRDLSYQVRGFSAVSAAQSGSIDSAIAGLLHRQTLSVTGYTNIATERVTDIALVENLPNGSKIYTAGAIYRIRLDN